LRDGGGGLEWKVTLAGIGPNGFLILPVNGDNRRRVGSKIQNPVARGGRGNQVGIDGEIEHFLPSGDLDAPKMLVTTGDEGRSTSHGGGAMHVSFGDDVPDLLA